MALKNGVQFRSNTATFTRPADTTAYASGDLVANDTVAANVVPLSWATPKSPFEVPCILLEKDDADVANATFRVHLFVSATPTIATTGDNGVFASVVSGVGSWYGAFEGIMQGFADGGRAICVPVDGVIRPDMVIEPGDLIYGLVEARGAYTPASGEIFTATLIQEFRT